MVIRENDLSRQCQHFRQEMEKVKGVDVTFHFDAFDSHSSQNEEKEGGRRKENEADR